MYFNDKKERQVTAGPIKKMGKTYAKKKSWSGECRIKTVSRTTLCIEEKKKRKKGGKNGSGSKKINSDRQWSGGRDESFFFLRRGSIQFNSISLYYLFREIK